MVNVGIVGAGLAGGLHARNLTGFRDVSIRAVCDPDVERARDLAGGCGALACRSVDDLLDAAPLDAVYVCVPPFAHGEPERAVLARRLPMYVEKPLAADGATAREIASQVAGAGVLTQVGFQWRYRAFVPEARELLAARPARLVLAHWLSDAPPAAWWRDERLSGGPVVEQAVHLLDLARWLAGEVEEVHAAGVRLPLPDGSGELLAASSALLRFASGAVGTASTTCVLDRHARAELRVLADGLALHLTARSMTVERGEETVRREDAGSAMERADRCFVDAVAGGPPDLRSPYHDALRSHELALAIAGSARTGRPVSPSG